MAKAPTCTTCATNYFQTQEKGSDLENCCYGSNETLILRMIHGGEFGELLYGEGAYLHDLRDELFSNAGEGLRSGELLLRLQRDADPAHDSRRRVWRATLWRRRLPARPARRIIFKRRRRP